MEHSLLHGFELAGQIIALGGALFVLCLVRPLVGRSLLQIHSGGIAARVLEEAGRWTAWGALAAALATGLNLFVETAETQGALSEPAPATFAGHRRDRGHGSALKGSRHQRKRRERNRRNAERAAAKALAAGNGS